MMSDWIKHGNTCQAWLPKTEEQLISMNAEKIVKVMKEKKVFG